MKRTAALIVLSYGLAACTIVPAGSSGERPTAAPRPTRESVQQQPTVAASEVPTAAAASEVPATEVPADPAEVTAGIERTLEQYVRAYNAGDIDGLNAVVDQQNPAFRRLVEQRYRYMAEATGGTSIGAMRVEAIVERGGGYWQADIRFGGSRVDWLFRNIDGEWLLSEPTEDEIGERIELERPRFTMVTYAWAGELNEAMADLMEQAAEQVEATLGRTPEQRFTLYLRPIFGIRPPVNATALAWYSAGSRPQSDRIDVFAPGSFAYGSYAADEGWEPDLYATLLHEYTHLVYQRSFARDYRITDWMSEGLAEYIAESPRAWEVQSAVLGDYVIPILADDGSDQDLDHMSTLQADNSLAYGLSYSLVAYIADTYGGLDGFWRLAAAMREVGGTGRDFYDEALQRAFGTDYAGFDRGWRAWLDQQYR